MKSLQKKCFGEYLVERMQKDAEAVSRLMRPAWYCLRRNVKGVCGVFERGKFIVVSRPQPPDLLETIF
jgi:hypothetical protein